MIFRRSLVRETDGHGDRAVRRPAGDPVHQPGAAAAGPRGRRRRRARGHPAAARLQRPVLLQHPAVGRAVPDRAADAFPLVPRQRDDRLVHLRPGARPPGCKPILLFAAPFLVAIVVLSLFLSPWAERRKLEYERQLESKDEIALLTPGLFREFRRAKLVVFVESINTFDGTIRNIFLHSIDDGKDVTTSPRSGTLRDGRQRRPLHRPERRAAGTRARPGTAELRVVEFERSGAGSSRPRCARCRSRAKAIPTAMLLAARRRRRARRDLLARCRCRISALVLTLLAIPLAYVNPRVGRSFNLLVGGVPVHALQQLPQHRAELHRPGQARISGSGSRCRTDRDRRRAAAVQPPAFGARVSCADPFARRAAA